MNRLAPLPVRTCGHSRFASGCTPCQAYDRAKNRRRHRLITYGRWDRNLIDAAPTAAHIRALRASGMGMKVIAETSGVGQAGLWRIMAGRQPTVLNSTAQRVLTIEVPGPPPAVGMARRLQALAACGYGAQYLAGRLGVDRATLRDWRRGLTSLPTHEAPTRVAALYDELLLEPAALGTTASGRARAAGRAAALGWLPPEAWTDATIDDPDAQPYSDQTATQYLDWEQLRRAKLPKDHPQWVPLSALTWAEQLHLFQEWVTNRLAQPNPPRDMGKRFRDLHRPVEAKLLRRLVAATPQLQGAADAQAA